MASGFFITGTDTGIGKTWVTVALLHHLRRQGLRAVAMKPVASGCLREGGGLRNEDALLLQRHGALPVPYETVNPFAFEPPIAPHIAAAEAGRSIDFAVVERCFQQLARDADFVLVEGVGGWAVPLGATQSVSDLAVTLGLPVILVVGIRLGCLNHAILTGQAIRASGVPWAGWVANCLEAGEPLVEENIDALRGRLNAPLLARLPAMAAPDFAALGDCFERAGLVRSVSRK